MPKATLTVITPTARVPYTGMAPGVVSGRYSIDEASIDAAALTAAAGGALITAKADAIDRQARVIRTSDGENVGYDFLSVDIGGVVEASFPGADDKAGGGLLLIGVKPAEAFLAAVASASPDAQREPIIIAGAGYGGVELAGALARRGATVTLATGTGGLAPKAPKKARRRIHRHLRRLGVDIALGARVVGGRTTEKGETLVALDNGETLPASLIVLATAVTPSPLLASVPELTDGTGFLRVNAYLQCAGDQSIFAAGDCASFASADDGCSLPKAGVYAVRQGPILAHNLRAAMIGGRKRWFDAQEKALAILSFYPAGAIAIRGGIFIDSPLVDVAKTLIDRRFVSRYRVRP